MERERKKMKGEEPTRIHIVIEPSTKEAPKLHITLPAENRLDYYIAKNWKKEVGKSIFMGMVGVASVLYGISSITSGYQEANDLSLKKGYLSLTLGLLLIQYSANNTNATLQVKKNHDISMKIRKI